MGGAEGAGDRCDDLFTRSRHDDDVVSTQLVICDQIGRLGEDEWIDDVVQSLRDDGLHLFHVPARTHRRQMLAHALHLIVIGAGQ